MVKDQASKGESFRRLHRESGTFIMPSAWNAGSARLLAASGFPAIGTTSAGIAFSLGRPDYAGCVSRAEMVARVRRIAEAVDQPVSADLERGYGVAPEEVAETVRQAIQAGVVGGNIDDYSGDPRRPLYDIGLAVERIGAARRIADESGIEFTLTARTDCFMVGHDGALAEAIERANLYNEAGADCLFAPGIKESWILARMVREIKAPLSVVVGMTGMSLTVAQLTNLRVKRIGIGGSLARATFGLIRRAAREILEEGTFNFAKEQISDAELSQLFAMWETEEAAA